MASFFSCPLIEKTEPDLPLAGQHEEAGNPCCQDAVDNSKVWDELAQVFLQRSFDETGKPENFRCNPDDSHAHVIRSDQHGTGNSIDGDKQGVYALGFQVQVENMVRGDKKIGEGKELPVPAA